MVRKPIFGIGLTLTVLVVFLLSLWGIVQFVLLPRMSLSWQTAVFVFVAAVLAILAVLAAVAQITGYSLRDLFSGRTSSDNVPNGNRIQELIRTIRSDLYSSDVCLPAVLSQALELCDRLGFDDYRTWIRKELAGFGGYEELEAELGSTTAVDSWINHWATHRLVDTHFKVNYLNERGSYNLDELPYGKIFIAVPVRKVAENIEGAKVDHADELFVQLVRLDRDRLMKLRNEIAEIAPGMEVPNDLKLFVRVAEYEKMLFGVRDKISELLTRAGSMQPKE
jgi:hypothetical protein